MSFFEQNLSNLISKLLKGEKLQKKMLLILNFVVTIGLEVGQQMPTD